MRRYATGESGTGHRARGDVHADYCVLVLGAVPMVRVGIANLTHAALGGNVRIVSAGWAERDRALAAAGGSANLVVAHPDGEAVSETCSRLASAVPGAGILVVLSAPGVEACAALARAGVQSIALGAPLEAWRRAIQAAAAGARRYRPTLDAVRAGALPLTRRQLEVFELLSMGISNKIIADRLDLSVGTIKLHVAAVLRALNARSRIEVVLRNAGASPLQWDSNPNRMGVAASRRAIFVRRVEGDERSD